MSPPTEVIHHIYLVSVSDYCVHSTIIYNRSVHTRYGVELKVIDYIMIGPWLCPIYSFKWLKRNTNGIL